MKGGVPILLLAIAAALVIALAGSASANQDVRCVQEQLARLGYDPGPADGQLGPRTRDASQKLRAKFSDNVWVRSLPLLDRSNAGRWCDYLARGFPAEANTKFGENRHPVLRSNRRASDKDYVICLQEQLARLGFKPGRADGQIGPRTRTAANLLKVEYSDQIWIRALPELATQTARKWCLYQSTAFPDLREFRPVLNWATVQTTSAVGQPAQDMAESGLSSVSRYFVTKWDMRVDRPIKLIGGETAFTLSQLANQALASLGYRGGGIPLAAKINSLCVGDRGVAGLAIENVLIVCWDAPQNDTGSAHRKWVRENRSVVWNVIAHELMHYFQNVLAGNQPGLRDKRAKPRGIGPTWLVEGAASFIGTDFAVSNRKNRRKLTISEFQKRLRDVKTPLRDLRRSWIRGTADHYLLAQFAMRLLVERHGDDVLFEYWRALGKGMDFEAAFAATFKTSLEEFETRFAELRTSKKAARNFARGK